MKPENYNTSSEDARLLPYLQSLVAVEGVLTHQKIVNEQAVLEEETNELEEKISRAFAALNSSTTNIEAMHTLLHQENTEKYRAKMQYLQQQIAECREDILGFLALARDVNSKAEHYDVDRQRRDVGIELAQLRYLQQYIMRLSK